MLDLKGIKFFQKSPQEALQILESSKTGLSWEEAAKRLEIFGRNALPAPKPTKIWLLFFRQFLNPLIYALIFASVFSMGLGHFSDAVFIAIVLLINALIGTFQEFSAEKSALALREMVSPKANVIRQGAEHEEVDSAELAPGDIVLVESGDKAPADMRLISANNLTVDESALTGESLPVVKNENAVFDQDISVADRSNMCFAGSLVASGRGKGVVVATGAETQLGSIAKSVQTNQQTKTPLLVRMEKFTKAVAMAVLALSALFAAALLLRGQGLEDVVVLTIAVAVSAIPEGLPVSITVALAVATRKMAKRKVIVRKLSAVEALGSCTYIASDKTGTLTINEMTVEALALPGEANELKLSEEDGANRAKETMSERVQEISLSAALCNEASLTKKNGEWIGHGDAVDVALLRMSFQNGVGSEALKEWEQMWIIPFESQNQYAASLHQKNGTHLLSVKGSFEKISAMSSTMAASQGEVPLERDSLLAQVEKLTMKGYRLLALGRKSVDPSCGPKDEINDLVFMGLVCMMDPPRPEAKISINKAQKAGVKVAMVTGDHPLTAFSIAKDLGICRSLEEVISGPQIKAAENGQWFDGKSVFARVEPTQKLDIVQRLQENGNFVAVTGDGANDAPALKRAHVGVAMGKRGTDVAKETADLIITDDKFDTLVNGIEEGRIAYANIRKVVYLLVSTGAAELLLFTLSVVFDTPMPLTPAQVLWLNLVTNGIQDKALAFEPAEGDELRKPPRRPKERIFDRLMLERVFLSALVVGSVSFYWFNDMLLSGVTLEEARNALLLLLVLFENLMIFNCRSEKKSIFALPPIKNKALIIGTLAAQGIHILAMYVPGLRELLAISPSALSHWPVLLALALTIVVVIEIYKGARFGKEAYSTI